MKKHDNFEMEHLNQHYKDMVRNYYIPDLRLKLRKLEITGIPEEIIQHLNSIKKITENFIHIVKLEVEGLQEKGGEPE